MSSFWRHQEFNSTHQIFHVFGGMKARFFMHDKVFGMRWNQRSFKFTRNLPNITNLIFPIRAVMWIGVERDEPDAFPCFCNRADTRATSSFGFSRQ